MFSWDNRNSSGPFGNFPFGFDPESFANKGHDEGASEASEEVGPRMRLPFSARTLVLFAIVVLLVVFFPAMADFLADYYWYESEGLTSVFWTRLIPRAGLMVVFSIAAFAILWPNFGYAARTARSLSRGTPFSALMSSKVVRWAPPVVAAMMALAAGSSSMDQWQMILKFVHGGAFGTKDAIFGNDIGFYVFSLPFWNFLRGWLSGILFNILFICGAVYLFLLMDRLRDGDYDLPRPVKAHVLALAAALAVCQGFSFLLARYMLLYNRDGVVFGPGYTDIHAVLPAQTILAALAFIAAGLLIFAIKKNSSWKFIGITAGAFVLTIVVLRGFYPELVQRYIVVPNEFQKEKDYIGNNISATLKAYGMDKIAAMEVTPDACITHEDAEEDPETLENMRLWDYRALLRSYKQLQEIRSYYDISAIDIDRYIIDGKRRQVMLAPRELDMSGMQNRTWVNQHLEFTHGYGIVMNGAREVGNNGQPLLMIRDLPMVSDVDIPLDRPEIYFGEKPLTYAFVKTRVNEFDYPMGESNARTTYQGDGGVPIGSLWRRLIYTLAFGDSRILFSDAFTSDSRVIYERNIRGRLSRAAPFLAYDSDPYIAVIGGRLLWIVDAYTTSGLYPYSEPVGSRRSGRVGQRVNYIRNSVKCTVDAYDGHMKFYVVDENDPVIAAWRGIFPALFSSKEEISPELRAHLRYPSDLFSIQADIYRTYHMTHPNTFYNKEDVWNTVSGDDGEGTLSSYYVVNKLIGSSIPEFLIMTPYTPAGRDNMISWMAGRCDGDNYGKLVLYRFPKQTLIYGPSQISALINQTPEISAQLSLWSQHGSDVILGHLLVVPVNNSLLYVRPLYLKATQGELPELKRVILSSGGHVVWDETFEGALDKLLNLPEGGEDLSLGIGIGSEAGAGIGATTGSGTVYGSGSVSGTGAYRAAVASDSQIQALARDARAAWDRSQAALRAADWNAYGKAMSDLEAALNGMFAK